MGAIPMGQEIAVTPIQIVSMVSTIANGGVYLPPHILLASTDAMKGDPGLKAAAFHPENELPSKLPDGAHRVISELTAAEMRKMMQDVVLIGTAHGAVHLNGYSAAGKTGTAQKIDPRTHTYSKVNFVASFVGFAPVNNPAVTIAVITDSPEHSMHFGAEASAPVFQKLAQEILEYLSVPHDQPLNSPAEMAKSQQDPVVDDEPQPHVDDLDSLFAEVNNLPADDPLRSAQPEQKQAPLSKDDLNGTATVAANHPAQAAPSAPITFDAHLLKAKEEAEAAESQPPPPLPQQPETPRATHGSVVLAAGRRIAVPSFLGEPVRRVIEQAGGMGLGVQVLGTGIARDQAPSAGTMVPEGTAVVVRFGR